MALVGKRRPNCLTRQGASPLDIPLKSSGIWNPEFRSQKPEWQAQAGELILSSLLLNSGFWILDSRNENKILVELNRCAVVVASQTLAL